jgi:hypothetical protein
VSAGRHRRNDLLPEPVARILIANWNVGVMGSAESGPHEDQKNLSCHGVLPELASTALRDAGKPSGCEHAVHCFDKQLLDRRLFVEGNLLELPQGFLSR